MGTLHILTDVIFVESDIYQLISAMRKKVFSHSKTGPAPAWLDSENYSSSFYLVILGEEIDCVKKMGNKRMHTESLKIIICGIEECECTVHFWNCGIKYSKFF